MSAKFCTVFPEPEKPGGYPLDLGIILDKTMTGKVLYFTVEYLDSRYQPIQRISELIPPSTYGGMTRLPLPEVGMFPTCRYLRCYINDENLTNPFSDFYLVDENGSYIVDEVGSLISI